VVGAAQRDCARVKRATFLFNPATAPFATYYLAPFNTAAASLGMQPMAAPVHSKSELESVIAAQPSDTGLVSMPDGFLNVYREELVSLAARYRLPAIYPWRFFPELGGLLSYGSDQRNMFRTAATYVDRVLRGEKPGDLAVQAPTKYELVINLKTAKSLDLDVPLILQQRPDEVIE
jgi:putative ABC transport system substrate-binding protein